MILSMRVRKFDPEKARYPIKMKISAEESAAVLKITSGFIQWSEIINSNSSEDIKLRNLIRKFEASLIRAIQEIEPGG